MLLTIALYYFVWSIAVFEFDADIWLRNKLRIEKTSWTKESHFIPADDFAHQTYTVSSKKAQKELVQTKPGGRGWSDKGKWSDIWGRPIFDEVRSYSWQ